MRGGPLAPQAYPQNSDVTVTTIDAAGRMAMNRSYYSSELVSAVMPPAPEPTVSQNARVWVGMPKNSALLKRMVSMPGLVSGRLAHE